MLGAEGAYLLLALIGSIAPIVYNWQIAALKPCSYFEGPRGGVNVNIIWGTVLIIFTLIVCWLGQVTVVIAPRQATRLRLIESEADVDPTFFADVRGEAAWDALSLWTLPVAGILLLLESPLWAYFGLIGGGMYLYFAGRGIAQRLIMQRRGIRVGKSEQLKLFYAALVLWGVIAVVTIVMAVMSLPLP